MRKGLHGLHVGLRIGDIYYSPSQFALGWIAARDPEVLEKYLNETVDRILAGDYDEKRIPTLVKLVKQYDSEGKKFDIHALEEIAAIAHNGTAKIIRNSGTKIDMGLQSASTRENIFVKVDSRERRSAKNPAHDIHLINALISDDLEDIIDKFNFTGGSQHSHYQEDALTFWNHGKQKDIPYERRHLDNIEKKYGKNVLAQYLRRVKIADHAVAEALIIVHDEIKKKIAGKPSKIKVDAKDSHLPIDYDRAPDLALEALLRIEYKLRGKNKELSRESRYMGSDIHQLNYADEYIPRKYKNMISKGKASIEVFVNSKSLPKYDFYWPLVQAFENHMLGEQRVLAGYSLEKIGKQYYTAIAFRNKSRQNKQYSVRILFDDRIYPVGEYKAVTAEDMSTALGKNIMERLNYSKSRLKKNHQEPKMWIDRDIKSGKKTVNTLYEPEPYIFKDAANLMFDNGIRSVNHVYFKNPKEMSSHIFMQYVRQMKEYKAGKKSVLKSESI